MEETTMKQKVTNKTRRKMLIGGAAAASTPLWMNMANAQSDTIKIGFPTPLTGPFSAEAQDQVKAAELAQKLGLEAREVSREEIKQLEPNVEINAIGAAYFKCDHHTTPHEFMKELKQYLKNAGVTFFINEKVEDLEVKNGKIIAIKTNKQTLKADEFVLAAGS